MCGRFARHSELRDLIDLTGALRWPGRVDAEFNIAPTRPVLVARRGEDGVRELVLLRWGLVPAWSKGPDHRYSMINARAEAVADKPAWRGAFRHRRALIPADGFYEWQAVDGGKQPWFIRLADRVPFVMAAIWEQWKGDGGIIESCAVITTAANTAVAHLHERMPVILHRTDIDEWLAADTSPGRALELLQPYPADEMELYPVSRAVNSARNGSSDLIEPLTGK